MSYLVRCTLLQIRRVTLTLRPCKIDFLTVIVEIFALTKFFECDNLLNSRNVNRSQSNINRNQSNDNRNQSHQLKSIEVLHIFGLRLIFD